MELILEFFQLFASKLNCLQELISLYFPGFPIPLSMTQCKKKLKTIYVNIWDLASGSLHHFTDFPAFRAYTQKKRTFPRDMAKEYRLDVFLRVL
jgi:hypothetical protein